MVVVPLPHPTHVPFTVRVVAVTEFAFTFVEDTVPPMMSFAVEVTHVKFGSEDRVELEVQNVTCVEVPLPTAGEFTVQFASPGLHEGFNVSPGAYGLAGGVANTGRITENVQ